jgi:putative membrane protein
MEESGHEQTVDSKYIQQHLANERTYLAWIRTAISLVGIGFVVVNLHFTLQEKISLLADQTAIFIGAIAFILGILTVLFSTMEYKKKMVQINIQTYKAPFNLVLTLSISLTLVILIMGFLFLVYIWNTFV